MNFFNKIKKHWKFSILLLLAIAVSICIAAPLVEALFSEDDVVHPVDSDIEKSSLIIGTHIIYLGAMTDDLYSMATESQSWSNQSKVYYKSELANGEWFEISLAYGLDDIVDTDKKVDISVINGLNVRYHTKSDGITYDLLEKKEVCIYDINNPYDLSKNSDLEELFSQSEVLKEKSEKNASDEYYEELMENFMDVKLTNASTKKYDKTIDKLQKYYKSLGGDSSTGETVMQVMKKLDDSRRAEVYETISEELETLLDKASLTDAEDDELTVNSELLAAIGNVTQRVQENLAKYQSNALNDSGDSEKDGKNILSNMEEKLYNSIIATDDVGMVIEQIDALNSVIDGNSKNTSLETAILKEMQEEAVRKIDNMLTSGTNEKYENEKAAGASEAALVKILCEQKKELEEALEELKFLYKSEATRKTTAKAKAFLQEKMEMAEGLKERVTDDKLKKYYDEAIDGMVDDLTYMYMYTVGDAAVELADMLLRKENLISAMNKCLDENNVVEAMQYENSLQQLLETIEEKEAELNEIITSDTATAKEKADAISQLKANSAVSEVQEMKSDALEAVKKLDFSDLNTIIDGIDVYVETAPMAVLEAYEEIYGKLAAQEILSEKVTDKDKKKIGDTMEKLEENVANNAAAFFGTELDQDDVMRIANEYFGLPVGTSFEEMGTTDEKYQAIVLYGIEKCAETLGGTKLKNIAQHFAEKMANGGNRYIYKKNKGDTRLLVPLDVVAECMDYRYVYLDSLNEVTLSKGIEYYRFKAFTKEVKRQNGKTDTMDYPAQLNRTLYIPLEYIQENISLGAISIEGSDYGIVYDSDMKEQTIEFVDILLSSES